MATNSGPSSVEWLGLGVSALAAYLAGVAAKRSAEAIRLQWLTNRPHLVGDRGAGTAVPPGYAAAGILVAHNIGNQPADCTSYTPPLPTTWCEIEILSGFGTIPPQGEAAFQWRVRQPPPDSPSGGDEWARATLRYRLPGDDTPFRWHLNVLVRQRRGETVAFIQDLPRPVREGVALGFLARSARWLNSGAVKVAQPVRRGAMWLLRKVGIGKGAA